MSNTKVLTWLDSVSGAKLVSHCGNEVALIRQNGDGYLARLRRAEFPADPNNHFTKRLNLATSPVRTFPTLRDAKMECEIALGETYDFANGVAL